MLKEKKRNMQLCTAKATLFHDFEHLQKYHILINDLVKARKGFFLSYSGAIQSV